MNNDCLEKVLKASMYDFIGHNIGMRSVLLCLAGLPT